MNAWLLCLLWMVGFEVGPGLHVAMHEHLGHHHHGPQADVHAEASHEHEHEHEHEAHGHEHEHAAHGHDHDHDQVVEWSEPRFEHETWLAVAPQDEARCLDDLGHGAHALAHRSIAAFPAASPWPPISVAPWTPLSRTESCRDPIVERTPRAVRARGPPA